LENEQVVLQFSDHPTPCGGVLSEGLVIRFPLEAQRLANFGKLVPVVEEFDRLLDGDGNAKADDNGRDMDEEIAPAVYWLIDRVHVEHR